MKYFYHKALIAFILFAPILGNAAPAPSKFVDNSTHIAATEAISVYPNPSHNKFYVLVSSGEKAKIKLFDATGSSIDGYEIDETEEAVYEINTSKLIEGVYVVQIQTEKILKTVRMVVA